MKNFLNLSLLVFLTIPIMVLFSCDYSRDQYIFTGTNENLTLSTYITKISQDTNINYARPELKSSDTILTGDSIYLLAKVNPAGIYQQELRWIVDGVSSTNMKYEYRQLCDSPGFFYPMLFVIDQFGDTLINTLEILVNTPPSIDSLVLPKNYGTKLPSEGDTTSIHFKWIASDFDNNAIHYQLKLFDNKSDSLILDTLVNNNLFNWNSTLKPLQLYKWQVI